MMPVIRIPDALFARLQQLPIATPLIDTAADVIEKLVDHYYETSEAGEAGRSEDSDSDTDGGSSNEPTQEFNGYPPDEPPDLLHTRIIVAEFGGETARNWNDLVCLAHRVARQHLRSFRAVKGASLSNIVEGAHLESGFHYVAEIDTSIQYVSADIAWRNALHLARALRLPIKVEFEWRRKREASHPGRKGLLEWRPE